MTEQKENRKTIVNSWNEWDPLKHVIVGRAEGGSSQTRGRISRRHRGQALRSANLAPGDLNHVFFSTGGGGIAISGSESMGSVLGTWWRSLPPAGALGSAQAWARQAAFR